MDVFNCPSPHYALKVAQLRLDIDALIERAAGELQEPERKRLFQYIEKAVKAKNGS